MQMMEIPNKLLKNSIFLRKIRVDSSLTLQILINKTGHLFEISENGVINVCLLENLTPDATIDFRLFFSYTKSDRNVYYLIRSLSKLFVVCRKETLKVIKVYENVSDVKTIDVSGVGDAHVEITLQDEMSSIVTDFSDKCDDEGDELFTNVLKKAQELAIESHEQYQTSQDSYATLYQKVCETLKFVPKNLRSPTSLENTILIPYDNHWVRIHNGHLVIGLPILNASFQRPLPASNITATVFNECLSDLKLKTCLYKCQDDYHSIEELEQKLASFVEDEHESVVDLNSRPKYDQEWIISENGILHAEESGVVILLLELSTLIASLVKSGCETLRLKCFINYCIDDTNDLQFYFGVVSLNQKELLSTKFWVSFDSRVLLDLLAVTTTSLTYQLSFEYTTVTSDTSIREFLSKQLGFRYISEPNKQFSDEILHDSTKKCHLLYQNEGFLKGTVIRIQVTSITKLNMKVYVLNEDQILSLLKSFINEFEDDCKISTPDHTLEKEKLGLELKYSLLNEATHVQITQNEDFIEEHCKIESKSDLAYVKLCSLISNEDASKTIIGNDV